MYISSPALTELQLGYVYSRRAEIGFCIYPPKKLVCETGITIGLLADIRKRHYPLHTDVSDFERYGIPVFKKR